METFYIVDNPAAQVQSYYNWSVAATERETVQPETALGSDCQFVDWFAEPGEHVTGPGEYLIGSQTIRHSDMVSGHSLPIAFGYDQIHLYDTAGDTYTYSNPLSSIVPGFFGVGLGKPLSPGIPEHDWNPMFVLTVPEPASLGRLAIGAVVAARSRTESKLVRKKRLGSGLDSGLNSSKFS
jgi:hypothetical protein